MTTAKAGEFISTFEAAQLLFVSHQHVVKLVESGTLPLHHITGEHRFLRKADVLAYKAKKQREARAFFDAQAEDQEPPGLMYSEGHAGSAICPYCERIVTTTFLRRDVPFSDGKGVVRNILVAVCDTCDAVVAIPAQSTAEIQAAQKK
ncbi:excisionase family DNA-binding protein [Burkholderia sp. PR2]|uniref:excisionase family DNA-binding protein n=1 Tax=Burkholderia sp. PR2 TaxID=3448078 RepID=UPI00402ACBAF